MMRPHQSFQDIDLGQFIETIPRLTPREMFEAIETYGYIGQVPARKAVCLMAYRHINRLRKLYIDNVPRESLPGKENTLLLGPTGCGKTFLVELIFQKILQIPTVIIDITAYSETGYIGQDVPSIITRLIHVAGHPALASIGIICLDEFDKISTGHNNALFAGQGTTKDVTGMGVQRELLKMLEASEITVPLNLSHATYADRIAFNTADVPFIACGAFSGFRKVIQSEQREPTLGFNISPERQRDGGIAISLTREEVEKAANFELYGIKPELIGRFARIVPFQALNRDDLKTILYQNTIRKYEHELRLDGIELEVQDDVYDLIVDRCLNKETGARGLQSLVTEYLEEACFEVYSAEGSGRIGLSVEGKEIRWAVSRS